MFFNEVGRDGVKKMESLRKKDSNRLHGLLLLFIIVYTVCWVAKRQ